MHLDVSALYSVHICDRILNYLLNKLIDAIESGFFI